MNLRADWHDTLEGIDPAAWEALLARAPAATIYQTREWLGCWLRHCGGGARPRVLAIHAHDGRLIGLLPLALTSQTLKRVWSRTVLTGLSALSPAHAQYLGPIIERESEGPVLEAMARAIPDAGEYDATYFENFVAGDPIEGLIARIEQVGGGRFRRWAGERTWSVALPRTVAEYRKSLSENLRKKLVRLSNRLAREGGTIERLDERVRLDAALAAFRRLSGERFGAKGGRSTMVEPELFAFVEDLTRTLHARGEAIVLEMSVAGEPAAVLLAFQRGEWIGYYNASFDPDREKLSPGTLLLDALVREAIARGAREVDLLAGSGGYKRQWAPDGGRPLHYAALARGGRSLPFSVWETLKARRRPGNLTDE